MSLISSLHCAHPVTVVSIGRSKVTQDGALQKLVNVYHPHCVYSQPFCKPCAEFQKFEFFSYYSMHPSWFQSFLLKYKNNETLETWLSFVNHHSEHQGCVTYCPIQIIILQPSFIKPSHPDKRHFSTDQNQHRPDIQCKALNNSSTSQESAYRFSNQTEMNGMATWNSVKNTQIKKSIIRFNIYLFVLPPDNCL